MIKLLGLLLIATSLLSFIVGAIIDSGYHSNNLITGNVIYNIATQTPININFYDYVKGIAFSYSIISMIMGVIFLFRV